MFDKENQFGLDERSIHVVDIGAAFLGEDPPYQVLLDRSLGSLTAFEPDEREFETLSRQLGDAANLLPYALGDGGVHTLYICGEGLGMTSLLEPDPSTLGFFNLFPEFGRVHDTATIATRRLDDIDELQPVDFLKMDVQGSELMILQNGHVKLSQCVAVQTEISFITLYKNQPTFADIDAEMRRQGFVPHTFTEVKKWAISPTIRNGEPRMAFNQLLEGDIVYVRDLIHPEGMSDDQIRKLAAIAHHVYGSPDLAARCLIELQKRDTVPLDTLQLYYQSLG